MADDFEAVLGDIEAEFSKELFVHRAAFVVAVSQVAGLVYKEALKHGVPRRLASEMAGTYWSVEMSTTDSPYMGQIIEIGEDEE